ncbi:hypothetical protein HZU77_013255 [Neisseriaceae bacterium TC5R-5]|nr:hypothetical protein [Neisseriaceae bacterium TC5R-5]
MQTKKAPGKNGFQYKPQFGVIVICDNESHQKEVFNKLKQAGLKLKVVSV